MSAKKSFCFGSLILCLLNSGVISAEPDTQVAEVAPSILRDEDPTQAEPADENVFTKGPKPTWIWGPENNSDYTITSSFSGPAKRVKLIVSCDNEQQVLVNGKQVASSTEWQEPVSIDVTQHVVAGTNTVQANVKNHGGIAAFAIKVVIERPDGKIDYLVSDTSWKVTDKKSGNEVKAEVRGKMGDAPWGDVFAGEVNEGGVPRDTFVLLPGFQVEKLYTVPKEELGSWVCITTDHKGRILASDQGGLGICRITPAPIGSQEETNVEKLDLNITSAQGMLTAFGHLYFSVNGGPGSGLYRAKYLEETDSYGPVEKLKAFSGGGEHGPHALRLSPDEKSIYVIAGNHTDPPFKAGEEQGNADYSSRISTNWGEDHLLPREWDANGHARGRMAPGGWIAITDPEGKTWEMFSVGYRNPYDMAFNADGELFAYDADMEWDYGAPWYRPTRVVHATSGSEFGWRSGTGKWPTYYLDSLPPLIDIGPGSPVGVEFGYGAKFPAKYQKALYICDWTFGTMYAIHIEPDGATYKATKEEFISRTPLPLTDVTIASDGAMYFTIGGRGTQSELFRCTYVGEESTAPTDATTDTAASSRKGRRIFEEYHGGRMPELPKIANATALARDQLVQQLDNTDRFVRYAARIGLEAHPEWLTKVLDNSHSIDQRIQWTAAIARINNPHSIPATQLLRSIEHPFQQLTERQQLDYLRTLSLIFTRLGEPADEVKTKLIEKLDSHFPSKSLEINRELVQVLLYLGSPTIVAKTVPLLEVESPKIESDLDGVLARNKGYGGSVKKVLENQPDLQQVHYAFVLRNAQVGWTAKLREDYFKWFKKAHTWSGGNSYQKFLANIDRQAYETMTEDQRILLEASGARQPFVMAVLPQPKGPGQDWTIDEVRALAKDGLKKRDFENGKNMFAATRCILCHRFNGDGGATGPDLTQLAGRFNIDALTEAIMDPSKVISDQYRASQFITKDGKVYSGRIVSESEETYTLVIDPEDATKIIDIPKANVEEMQPSQTSLMPKDLLKPLNQDEVLDLLAYLLSRGDQRDPMFERKK